ncbi:hypothetical protein MJG53_001815 [Ovis ammon polii x Ovis aries]|uniref:Uncharacterized protein n=1 Tax=Ovis ammon polii x Ovis aries TaxID=2918886 RepID=A0ACB9VMV0_9CETA|nr:hypothetical protein MJG53_001815 [Ovis ammon polii x Ovis aries]
MISDLKDEIYDKVQLLTMLESNDSLFSLDNLFFEKTDEAENHLDSEKSLDWFLPPAPLISEIPDTQALEEEIESCKLLGQNKRSKMLPSNLRITNEDTNYVSQTQKFQFDFPSNEYEEDDLNLGGAEFRKTDNLLSALLLIRLFKISDNIHEDVYSNDSENLDSNIDSVKIVQTEANKGKSWKGSNSKQKPQYSDCYILTASDTLFASEIREGIIKAPSFPVASQPHTVQDRNFVICAPTGSGKTVLFELAITRLLMEVPLPWSNIKIVYMAPIKALCSQRFDDWKKKFGPIGLNCKELTGDTVMDDLFEIQHAHIIMTTPVHVVKDENRGPTLEVVVSRMKTVQFLSHAVENTNSIVPMRFVAVSATIPNAEDIAEWLSDGERAAVCLKMDERHRPVKLRKVVLGFPCSDNQTEFKFDLTLNYKIASIIQTYSDQKPTLVFCATRKGVQQAASVLVKDAKFIMTVEQKQRLQKCAYSIKDSKLRDILIHGVAYHHAGMELSDRKVVEGAFTVGDIPVLFTTSTLAMGVNLPAHLVVIKSTMHYAGGMFEEYSETDILQMIGRAGRPQFDTTATAVIMTRLSTKEKYIQMLACSDTIESSLHRHLIEHLNAEIVLHTITNVNIALEWIRSTLLYIRALKNPSHYELCLKNLNDLSSLDLIKMDEDINFKPTEAGRLMAWYYITFETVKKFCTISGKETLSDLVTMIASCKEFLDVQLRINEKKALNTLNKDPNRITIRFPMEGRIKTREMKILNRHPPFGTQIKETVMYLPKYELEVEQITRYSDTMAEILVTVMLRNFEQLRTKRTAPNSHYVTLIIGDADNQLVFKHKIMDSVLLKAGNWAKKFDVRRALKSEDLSINLISSEYVGLDIQRKFTVFYLGPKRFGNQIIIQKKSETEISHSEHSDRSTVAGPKKGMTASKKPGNRECNHHCKNKHTCGHDCCKTGVAQKSEVKESTISSYLSDLRNRNAVSSLPPVKRLKMQVNKSPGVGLKDFGFAPKPSLPSIARSEYLNTPELPVMEQRDQHEIYTKSQQQQPSAYQDKEVLKVNFEFGNEIWDDFDDENLVEITSFSAETEKTKTSDFFNLKVDQVFFVLPQHPVGALFLLDRLMAGCPLSELRLLFSRSLFGKQKLYKDSFWCFTLALRSRLLDPKGIVNNFLNQINIQYGKAHQIYYCMQTHVGPLQCRS